MRVKYNQKDIDYLNENNKNKLNFEDFLDKKSSFFDSNKELFLEIGPGKGKFIIDLASKNLDKNFLVVELNKTISGVALRKIDESKLSNIKLMCIDFYKLSDSLKEGIFDGIFLNFSDPWPKKRHTKRRLTSPNFLKAYNKVLKMNKYIYLKTDNEGFFDYSLEQFLNAKFKLNYLNRDYKEDFDFDALTEYEEKFLNKGVKIKKMIVEKTEETNCEII